MKQVLLLFIFLYSTAAVAQLTIDPEYNITGDVDVSNFGQEFTTTNEGTETLEYFWQLERSDAMPREWSFTVCDAVLCHAAGVESTPCGDSQFTNVLNPGVSITYNKLSLNPNGILGDHSVTIKFSTVCGDFSDDNLIGQTTMNFSVTGQSSTEDEFLSDDLLIYPNPTVDRFQVKNDENVKAVSVFNIVGKTVMTESHKAGQTHDVTNLDKGIYLVRMVDRNEKTLKVIRLTKD